MAIQNLIINGKTYAKYEIENDVLYIKMILPLIPINNVELTNNEDLIAFIIQAVEGKKVRTLAYLNI